ncbi:MAG: hypothetical protein KH704_11770 [Clostridiales bacterium]|nr:hypothetical protein [Clostridiales bacterium]
MGDTYHFQVNLGGMLDVLSNHLYKSPDVFLRELLQNGVDAITLRQKEQPGWNGGRLTIQVDPGRRLIFRDNGAGLSMGSCQLCNRLGRLCPKSLNVRTNYGYQKAQIDIDYGYSFLPCRLCFYAGARTFWRRNLFGRRGGIRV